MIAVIDVVGNNLSSLCNAIERLGHEPVLTHSRACIAKASHVILPGVGTAAVAMQALVEHNLIEPIKALKQPLLGICLGMQILFDYLEEGEVSGLGLLKGRVVGLPAKAKFCLPHMGWNRLFWGKPSSLQEGIPQGAYVYFVHSYALAVGEDTAAITEHSMDFSAVVEKGNCYGMQFHPEKSGETGLALLKNFLNLSGVREEPFGTAR